MFFIIFSHSYNKYFLFMELFDDLFVIVETVGNGFSFEQRRMDVRHLVALFHRRMVATLSFIEKVELTSECFRF